MKINCSLIKDLLPLYVKEETSAESNSIINEHLEECEDCRELQRMLMAEDTVTTESAKDNGFVKALKKVKRRFIIRTAIAMLLAVVLAGAFMFMFYGVIPARSSDVEIVPEVTIISDSDLGYDGSDIEYYNVAFHLTLKKADRCIDVRHGYYDDPEELDKCYEFKVYSQIKLPFDDRGKKPECWSLDLPFAQLTGNEKVIFHFSDKDVEYKIKELVEQAGLDMKKAA